MSARAGAPAPRALGYAAGMRLCSALVPLALTACGSVTPSMRYEAYAARERLPLAVAVRVHVAPVPSGSA